MGLEREREWRRKVGEVELEGPARDRVGRITRKKKCFKKEKLQYLPIPLT